MKTIDITDKECSYNITDIEKGDILITAIGKFKCKKSNNGSIVCERINKENQNEN